MADLTISAAAVNPALVIEQLTGPASVALDKGELVRLDTSTGKFVKAKATTAANARACGVVITKAAAAGQTVTVVRKGLLNVGNALSALNFDADVFLSDTDGLAGDGAGTVSKVIGTVVPGWGATAGDRLLRIDL